MVDLRENALNILSEVLDGKNLVAKMIANDEDEDRAFVSMLVLTAFRKLVFIRKILKSLVVKKLSKQDLTTQAALVLGAVELLYMQTPNYAVINSYVNLVKKKKDKFAGGFVNAILRRIAQQKNVFLGKDTGEFFSQNFKTLLRKSYSAKEVHDIEKMSMLQPSLDITCISEESAKKLGGYKLPLGTVRLTVKGKINLLPDYNKGTWWVQDFSSSLAIKMLGEVKGKKVLELCAAPGGKTAQLLAGGAEVCCLDISEDRLKVLRENLVRLKMKPKEVICKEGVSFLEGTQDKYDIVVLDAPCSATGTIRRHPEIVHLKSEDDVVRQSALQKSFLDKVSSVLKKKGILLYCTCSLCKEEGEWQIQDFLEKNRQYELVNLENMVPEELAQIVTKEGFIRVLPQHLNKFGGADGFFIACLRKVGEDVF
ncbi:MAG: methyltransferase domain-containing protein [Alphaproteobacteria bacterium]|nr:methyltransferase domain-containing protein [Alphaproteobacteria bacterium]